MMRVINKPRGQNAAWVLGAALLGVALSSVPARAQGDETIIGGTTQATQDVLPEGGLSLVPADVLTSLKLGGKAATNAQVQIVPVEGQPFAQALRITTTGKSAEGDITLSVDTTRTFREVETVFIRFYLRTLASEAADGNGLIKSNIEANLKGGSRAFYAGTARDKVGAGWRRYDSPAMGMRGYGAGEARFELRVGGAAQTLEIGGIQVLNYQRRRLPHQLPHAPGGTYEGREANASWRQDAQARIERYRKGDLTIRVVDAQGKPIPNAQVKVEMTRHAYGFGTAVSENFFAASESTPDGAKYRAAMKKYFNLAVLEGGHKWKPWESSKQSRDNTIATVNWMRENGIAVRGHNLVWPGWTNLPANLKTEYEKTKAEQGPDAAKAYLQKRIHDHIVEITIDGCIRPRSRKRHSRSYRRNHDGFQRPTDRLGCD